MPDELDLEAVRYWSRYARKFGLEGLPGTEAIEHPLNPTYVRLRVEYDQMERSRRWPFKRRRRRPRRSAEETALAARLLREEGLVIGAIADKLGLTVPISGGCSRRQVRNPERRSLPMA